MFYYYSAEGKVRVRKASVIGCLVSCKNTKLFTLGTEPIGWTAVDFDDSDWTDSVEYTKSSWADIEGAHYIWRSTFSWYDTCLFRHTFYLEELKTNVIIYFNHDNDLYGLYLNGNLVTSQVYGTDYPPYYQNIYTADISSYLQVGKNVISAKVANYQVPGMFQFSVPAIVVPRAGVAHYKIDDTSWGRVHRCR